MVFPPKLISQTSPETIIRQIPIKGWFAKYLTRFPQTTVPTGSYRDCHSPECGKALAPCYWSLTTKAPPKALGSRQAVLLTSEITTISEHLDLHIQGSEDRSHELRQVAPSGRPCPHSSNEAVGLDQHLSISNCRCII